MDARDVEKIRELLNFSGYPFQHYCADRIAKIDGFQLNLFVADFSMGNVVQGEIPADKLPLDGPKKWVTYEFAKRVRRRAGVIISTAQIRSRL